jgi:GTP cyclohydrolase IA
MSEDVLKDSWMPDTPVSTKIRERIKKAGKRFHANDNIAEFIEDGEIDLLQSEVQEKLQGVLDSLVIDTANDHNTQETAKRVAKMYIRETFGGRFNPAPRVTSFPNMGYKSMYTSGPISIRSTCAHHFQNIVGRAWVGIIPNGEVIGLSKFNRIVHHIVERPQIQEEMTTQIADELKKYAKTENLAVVVKAEHHCMTHRGVREHESDMTTAIMLGAFKDDPATRDEFYKICMSTSDGIYTIDDWSMGAINTGTMSESVDVSYNLGQLSLDYDQELRDKYPALRDAWDHYNNVKKMCEAKEQENED